MKKFAAGLLILLTASVVEPSGPTATYARFWSHHATGPPGESFLAGDLGVLEAGFSVPALYVAWRHISGLGLQPKEREVLREAFWPTPRNPAKPRPVDAQERWRQARKLVEGMAYIGWISQVRSGQEEHDGQMRYFSYPNCLDDAFVTAARTLEERIVKFGANSREVDEWLRGQDIVFSNCGSGESIPESLDASWNPLLRADRNYQIAAAHFYIGHFEVAEGHFRGIAADTASPWCGLSHYLVARAQVRAERWEEAIEYLHSILDDPERESYHGASKRLLAFIAVRFEAAETTRRLSALLAAPVLPEQVRQPIIDYGVLLQRTEPTEDELSSWLTTLASGGSSAAVEALHRFEAEDSAVWYVAALLLADQDHLSLDQIDALLAAEVDLPPPAALTVVWHRSRLLESRGRLDEVRKDIEAALESDLSIADRNRFQTLLAHFAEDLETYLRLMQQVVIELDTEDGSHCPAASCVSDPTAVLLPKEAVQQLNRLSARELLELVGRDILADHLKRRVGLAGLTRALVLGDHALVREHAEFLIELVPEMVPELVAYRSAPEEESAFAAALLILEFPGLHPDIHADLGRTAQLGHFDGFRGNWWCSGETFDFGDSPSAEFFADTPERAATHQELAGLEAGPIHLGNAVMTWADVHPKDPRIPEALHKIVRATRIGCWWKTSYGVVSKPAFELLHRRYPKSPWTAKTPYWFN